MVLYCIIVQKSPIFVQLSPIQCTYSNIFIRFFKFSPTKTIILQNSYRVIGVLCGLRQGVLSSQCGHFISFGTKYSVIARSNATWQSPGRVTAFVFPSRANFYCFLHNCQYDTLAKYMTDCDIFLESYKSLN